MSDFQTPKYFKDPVFNNLASDIDLSTGDVLKNKELLVALIRSQIPNYLKNLYEETKIEHTYKFLESLLRHLVIFFYKNRANSQNFDLDFEELSNAQIEKKIKFLINQGKDPSEYLYYIIYLYESFSEYNILWVLKTFYYGIQEYLVNYFVEIESDVNTADNDSYSHFQNLVTLHELLDRVLNELDFHNNQYSM